MAQQENQENQESQESQESNREERLTGANSTVRNYALGSMAVGIVPIPLVDVTMLTGVQLKLLHSLAKVYKIEFSEELGKSLIASLLGGVLPVSVAGAGASLLKMIPIVGQVSGIVSMAVLGGASTYAVGKVFIQHFESGGTFLDFDPEKMRAYFVAEYEKGKKMFSKSKPDDTEQE
ncbi:MAG: DUF697 domain-containing protein [Gammaproteobacteria bacterium]|nr:DUF697 domain-containing protein [Gammaproteobacteria bacterium]